MAESAHPVLTDEGGAILDERTGRWTHLTPAASAALMLLLAGTTEEEAAGHYAQRYGIDAGQAAVDVRMVGAALIALGLATQEPVSRHHWWGWWR
ncbi:PqqD family peptide modification chaperone [Streptomyces clavifer]|uniref:PqqD family peptide modification chaperone n=1 Tax=Streptomyces clavifer TaxID=68188 RepID=UPI00382B60AB